MEYVTFLWPLNEEVALRYTDYVIPSGSGTRLVTHAAPAFSIETGEPMPEEVLSEMAGPVTDDYQEALNRLTTLADETASNLIAL